MRKKPYTVEELFHAITDNLKEEGADFSFVDYANARSYESTSRKEIKNDDIYISCVLDPGCEGVYATLHLLMREGNERLQVPFGTIKTLEEGPEAYAKMGKLYGQYCSALLRLTSNQKDFYYEGKVLYKVIDGEEKGVGIYVIDDVQLSKYCQDFFKSCDTVKVYDLEQRTQYTIGNPEKEAVNV